MTLTSTPTPSLLIPCFFSESILHTHSLVLSYFSPDRDYLFYDTMDSSSWPLAKQLNFTTGQQLIQLPTNLLEIFIPGYGTTSALLSETFGFDIKLIVSISLFIFALLKSVDYLRHQIISFLTRFGTCYIAIDSTGDAYHWVMSLLRQKGVGVQASGLLAVSSLHVGSWQPAQSDNLQFEVDGVPLAHTSSNTDGKKPTVRYEPDLGTWLYFWHDGRLSLWYRQKEQQKANVIDFLGDTKIEGRLYCFSRSTAPIKAFIQDALNEHQRKNAAFTSIRRPAPSKQRRSGNNPWIKVATRPSRPLDTIVLDDERKTQIIADIEEYLDPNTRRWYAGRGIPYRRGYVSYMLGHTPITPYYYETEMTLISTEVIVRSARNRQDFLIFCTRWRFWP